MAEKPTHPLRFDCYHCKKANNYPGISIDDNSKDEAMTVVKRCTNCGTENLINIPAGWKANKLDTILRGLTPK
jgi:hypothetical protein